MSKIFNKNDFVMETLSSCSQGLFDWDIINAATIFKSGYKETESEMVVIRGYANAVNCLTKEIIAQNHINGAAIAVRCDSLVIPFIFLVRHTVELLLKFVRRQLGLSSPAKHGLRILWKDIEDQLLQYSNEKETLDSVQVFIDVLEELDPDGSHARYSNDKKGELYYSKAKFINVQAVNNFLQTKLSNLVDCRYFKVDNNESSDKKEN